MFEIVQYLFSLCVYKYMYSRKNADTHTYNASTKIDVSNTIDSFKFADNVYSVVLDSAVQFSHFLESNSLFLERGSAFTYELVRCFLFRCVVVALHPLILLLL